MRDLLSPNVTTWSHECQHGIIRGDGSGNIHDTANAMQDLASPGILGLARGRDLDLSIIAKVPNGVS
jgi:hypothetical protein